MGGSREKIHVSSWCAARWPAVPIALGVGTRLATMHYQQGSPTKHIQPPNPSWWWCWFPGGTIRWWHHPHQSSWRHLNMNYSLSRRFWNPFTIYRAEGELCKILYCPTQPSARWGRTTCGSLSMQASGITIYIPWTPSGHNKASCRALWANHEQNGEEAQFDLIHAYSRWTAAVGKLSHCIHDHLSHVCSHYPSSNHPVLWKGTETLPLAWTRKQRQDEATGCLVQVHQAKKERWSRHTQSQDSEHHPATKEPRQALQ